ncbi:MAG: ATP-binding protein [Collinsella sp.]|nr:ATP-binding protein [Collinsella sp.]
MSSKNSIRLCVQADPALARLVRMTASNVATLAAMSVDRVEDVRMAAEEAFIYACASGPGAELEIDFAYDAERVAMTFGLDGIAFGSAGDEDATSAYADLILGAVCDSYEKREDSSALELVLKADA